MKINENIKIIGMNVVLIPYEKAHVEKYHEWMENEEIRRLTGSERLSLEEEYEMQRSWREDEDKLTFIVLAKDTSNKDEISSMIGDVNLFINQEDASAEAEVMIAESTARGKGVATEALKLLFSYALRNLNIRRFFAKITEDNVISLKLFENKLEFQRISYSSAFKEHTLELPEDKMKPYETYLTPAQVTEYKKDCPIDSHNKT